MTAGAQSQPAVAADDEGGFAIVWTEQPTSGNTRVVLRQYAGDGSALTGELTVNTNGDATDAQPDVAYVTTDSGAYFIVVWQGSVSGAQRDGGSYSDADGVFSRAYQQGTGGWSWSDIQIVNTTTAGAQRRPTVASTRSGFAVAWEVTGTGPSAEKFLQRYVTPTMQASGETRVGFEYAGGVGSSYAVMSDGGLVIAWEVSALGATGVAAQMFAADGTPVGQQFLVSGLARKPPPAFRSTNPSPASTAGRRSAKCPAKPAAAVSASRSSRVRSTANANWTTRSRE